MAKLLIFEVMCEQIFHQDAFDFYFHGTTNKKFHGTTNIFNQTHIHLNIQV